MEKKPKITQEDLKQLGKSWYHPHLNIKDAEILLQVKGKPGSFLVRPSSKDASQFTLSIRVPVHGKKKDYEVKHITICQKQSNEKSEFSLLTMNRVRAFNIDDLLAYHMQHPIDIGNGRQIYLKHVLNCEDPAAVSWFHGFIPPEDVERRLTKRSALLMHETSSEPGMYTLSVRTSKAREPCKVAHTHVEKLESGLYRVAGNPNLDQRPSLPDLVRGMIGQRLPLKASKEMIELKYPVASTLVRACDMKKRCDLLGQPSKEPPHRTGYHEEFLMLENMPTDPALPALTKEICVQPNNKAQNRYYNILPYDQTLVKLTDGEGRDFINANYIDSKKIDEEIEATTYIAAQDPLGHTMVDFWRMIIQEKVRVIVMATKVVERGKDKCAKYWADDIQPHVEFPTDCSTIHVKHVRTDDLGVYSLREFSVSRDGQNSVRPFSVFQFHFVAWPDFGVPKDPGLMLQFMRTFKIKYKELKDKQVRMREKPGPLLIHCSAGIGRTGIVIVLDTLIQQIILRGVTCAIDIFDVVRLLRRQREGMIQTDPQYKFLYVAIEHFVGTMVQRMDTGELTIEARNQAGTKPAEKQSISSSNVNPLLPKRVVECGSIPSAENLAQFWSTISSSSATGSSAIVLLTDKHKTMERTYLHWLPTADKPIHLPTGLDVVEKRRQEVDGITHVTIHIRATEHTYNNYNATYMDMTGKYGKQHDCQVLLVDPTSPAGVVSAWKVLQKTLLFTACSFKRDDIDVFAVSMFLLDQSHAYDAVDVPAAVKQLRKQHPMMISNEEDYCFIYKVLDIFSDK